MAAQISTLLFPRDMLNPKLVDDHFRSEANAARDAGLTVKLIDHDAIVAGDLAAGLRGLEGPDHDVLYRGWMIRPDRYDDLADGLGGRDISLRTNPAKFRGAHHLPSWFDTLAAATPESVWTDSADLDELVAALGKLGSGPAVLKDYSKSEKHYWDEAMFIPDVTDTVQALSVAERFLELRDTAFDTGFVVRRYEQLEQPEARTWWLDGRCVAISAHPDTPDQSQRSVELSTIERLIADLELGFITADLAISATTDEARIVEIGDGQVSDRPSSLPPEDFIEALTS
ncbi:MAG: ATP-grasp domain-containing protein [Actinomycetota bacterium]